MAVMGVSIGDGPFVPMSVELFADSPKSVDVITAAIRDLNDSIMYGPKLGPGRPIRRYGWLPKGKPAGPYQRRAQRPIEHEWVEAVVETIYPTYG